MSKNAACVFIKRLKRLGMRALSILLLLACCISSFSTSAAFENTNNATFSNQSNQFVPVDQAFPFSHQLFSQQPLSQQPSQQSMSVELSWQITPGYYLYQDRFAITGNGIDITYSLPQGTPYHDEFFGDVVIYTDPILVVAQLRFDLNDVKPANPTITVEYQGCAKAGFCYPPERKVIPLSTLPSSELAPISQSQQQGFAYSLANQSWALALFFVLGMGLAFTPCVLPMYPIITSLVLGSKDLTKTKALWLSFVYVQGMAITYSILGLVVASAGLQFQALLQSPAVLIAISLLFVILALSMFGLFTLQVPSRIQVRLSNWSAHRQGGASISVFVMGAISGLICSPCTTAPLSGALLYVAQSGDVLTGASALYLLSLGMGVPLIFVAVFGQQLLPRSGEWMDKVKILFGFILLAAPVFLLERITPNWASASLWTLLGLSAFGWLYWQKNHLPFGGWKQTTLGVIAVLGMIAAIKPILPFVLEQHQPNTANPSSSLAPSLIQFTSINTIEDLQRELALAKQNQQPVMLDLYADWCVACKEFEHKTFSDPQVAQQLHGFHLLQADVTNNQAHDFDLLASLNILGLPTIVFWDAQGNQTDSARITGFMDAPSFIQHVQGSLLSVTSNK
jgi:thiol:disulfide interchange protein DsbD